MPARKKRPIRAEDLYRFHIATDCQIAPDGERVLFSVQRVERRTEKKYATIWTVPARGGEAAPFTCGDHTDSDPRFSPDGAKVAFLSNRADGEQAQLYLISTSGGEARPLTRLRGEFGSFAFSPDGRKIAFAFRQKDPEEIEREKDETKKKLGIVSRHITRTFYKMDGEGYLPRQRWHLWVVDLDSGRTRQLTRGEVHDQSAPCFSPDGKSIACVTTFGPDPDLDPAAVDIVLVPAAGGEPRPLHTPPGGKDHPVFSPDGEHIAYLGSRGADDWWQNESLWVVRADGRGRARDLTRSFDLHAAHVTLGDVAGAGSTRPPVWSAAGDRLFFQASRHGDTALYSVSAGGRRSGLERVVDEPGVVGAFGLDRAGRRLAFVHATLTDPGQVKICDLPATQPRTLTRLNAFLRDVELGRIEELWFKGGGGKVQGWILKPPGFRRTRRYPAILQIHGGPFTQYGRAFMHEFYYLAAQGYAVFFCNPRGSQGYGGEHARALWQHWGEPDYPDLMAFANLLARRPYIDPGRMGVTGGSYGGYMTLWIVARTRRFAAAVTQRCASNLLSMWGSSDFNWYFQKECGDKPPWEHFAEYWRQSPMSQIHRIRTPTLVIHSEQDLRCAQEQGEQVYVALKKLGVDTELVLFPEEAHGLSRGGRTDRRIARLEHMRRWFDRYLK